MKIVLAVVALFVAIEAKAYQSRENYYDRLGFMNNPGPPWLYAPQPNYHQNDRFGPNIEWICHSQKTNDMMIITADNMRQNSGRGPWWQRQNFPPGHQRHNGNWHYLPQEIFIIRPESTGTDVGNDGSQRPLPFPTTPETHNNNNNNKPQTTPETYNNNNNNEPQTTPINIGGEGLIDIRIGAE